MPRIVLNIVVFIVCFVSGWIVAPLGTSTDRVVLTRKEPTQAPAKYDFFTTHPAANANKQVSKNELRTFETKTFCYDLKILPIWRALLRDKNSREVLEYSTSETERDCRDILEVKYVDLNGDKVKEALVRALTIPACGAVGNCDFWILAKQRNQHRILLHGDDYWDITAMGDQVLRSRTNGFRDILLKGHFSASETSYSTFKFNGRNYVETKCLYQVPKERMGEKTTWHFITCKEFSKRINDSLNWATCAAKEVFSRRKSVALHAVPVAVPLIFDLSGS